ncbi:Ribonucleotide-diphosphate reductase (RNR), small subunit [Puccinia graminis f. sp. tritici]|uniref:Ribonucleotide-diphosphate reductase (RNR), small subunit n=1 Tax=Puccinia graminis f. sp. tritici TaxID=56615 RepID=A0A5B0P736_PUCGR|nr:Ribonucleotide-diphosphate reductase (RNR), small subunit [Puccinia graminis f. sp. tritici]
MRMVIRLSCTAQPRRPVAQLSWKHSAVTAQGPATSIQKPLLHSSPRLQPNDPTNIRFQLTPTTTPSHPDNTHSYINISINHDVSLRTRAKNLSLTPSQLNPLIISVAAPLSTNRFVGNLDITSDDQEPLLKEDGHRFVLFPIKLHEIWASYKRAEASFWTAEEIDLSKDMHDWDNKLNADEKHFHQTRPRPSSPPPMGSSNENLIERFQWRGFQWPKHVASTDSRS